MIIVVQYFADFGAITIMKAMHDTRDALGPTVYILFFFLALSAVLGVVALVVLFRGRFGRFTQLDKGLYTALVICGWLAPYVATTFMR